MRPPRARSPHLVAGSCAASWYVRSRDSSSARPTIDAMTMTERPVTQSTLLASWSTAKVRAPSSASEKPAVAAAARRVNTAQKGRPAPTIAAHSAGTHGDTRTHVPKRLRRQVAGGGAAGGAR
jgi:hypothetical protein